MRLLPDGATCQRPPQAPELDPHPSDTGIKPYDSDLTASARIT